MKYKSFNDLYSLKNQQVTVNEKTGTIVDIREDKIFIQFETENIYNEYSIDNLKSETITLIDSDTELAMLLNFRKDELDSSISPLFNRNVNQNISIDVQKIILDEWRLL